MIVPAAVAAALHWKTTRKLRARIDGLRSFPLLTPPQRRRVYGDRLHELLQVLGNRPDALPEWREAARITDSAELLAQWSALPIMGKGLLRERFQPEPMAARFALHGRVSASGGSTGEPTRFFHDDAMLASGVARMYHVRRRLGWSPGMPCVSVWGADQDIGKEVSARNRIGLALRRELVIPGFRIDRGTAERFVALVNRHAPVAVFGYTSLLAQVARLAIEHRLAVAPGAIRVAWNGAEMLTLDQSNLFREAFGVPLHDMYGGRELGALACQFHQGGPLEILGPDVLLEIVDESGKPATPGTTGRLLATSTVCAGTPFLRYEIGDLAVADPEHQDEGGLWALRALCGRQAGIILLPDGTSLNNLYWNHLFKEFPEVHQFQVVVRDADLLIRLSGSGFSEESERGLRAKLKVILPSLDVRLEWADRISLTRAGKLVQVVDERAPHEGP